MNTAKDSKMRKLWEDATRQAVQDAVISLVTKNGFRGFTMEQIAAEAGVAKGTLYLHFKSKDDLLESVKEASFSPLQKELAAILDSERAPVKKIEDFVMYQFEYFDKHRNLIRFLLEERRVAQLHKHRMKDNRYKEVISRIASVLETGVSAGEFRKMETDKVAIMLFESSIAVMVQRLWSESPGRWENDARILIDVFLLGIGAESASLERIS